MRPQTAFDVIVVLLALSCLAGEARAFDDSKPPPFIRGSVCDKTTGLPLVGVRVSIYGEDNEATTDQEGRFEIRLPARGIVQLLFEKDSYSPQLVKMDGRRGAGRAADIRVEMQALRQEVIVTADEVRQAEAVASSHLKIGGEELQKIPGAMEDVGRALQVLPGIASPGDFKNDLIVRGGSPSENLFVIDNIDIPSLSHFSSQNSSGGAIGWLHPHLLDNVEFLSGGFPSSYGDRLSSVARITLREGRRQRLHEDLHLSVFGLGGTLEGPFFSRRGSWLLSLRKDFIGRIPRQMAQDLSVVPDYLDGQVKIVYDFSPRYRLSFVGLGAKDRFSVREEEDPAKGLDIRIADRQSAVGMTLRMTPWKRLVSYLTVSQVDIRSTYDLNDNGKKDYSTDSKDIENTVKLDMTYSPGPRLQLAAGISYKNILADHALYYKGGYLVVDRLGYRYTRKSTDSRFRSEKEAAYVQLTGRPLPWLKASFGLRMDSFAFIQDSSLSPRAGLSIEPLKGTSLNISYGIYYQSPLTLWLASHPQNASLRFLRAEHIVCGLEQIIGGGVLLRLEIFRKNYSRYPVDSRNPYSTLANSGGSIIPSYFGSPLVNSGRGYSRGAEISVRTRSSAMVSWLVDYSYSDVRYKALDGVLRPGDFDFGGVFNAVLSFRPWTSWDLAVRWRYVGGQPYTPLDLALSEQKNTAYYDMTRINTDRYPAYHRFDVRLEKAWQFARWRLQAYLDVQNLYNRRNVYLYMWMDREFKPIYYLPILPLIGIRAEF